MSTEIERVKGVKRYRHPVSGIVYFYHRATRQRIKSEWGSPEFLKEVEALDAFVRKPKVVERGSTEPVVRKERTNQQITIPGHFALLSKTILARAKHMGIEVDLTLDDLIAIYAEQDGRCALTGIKFSLRVGMQYRLRPWSPSPDRIDQKKGYVRGNVRLLCTAVNIARSDWDDDVFLTMAHAAYEHSLKKLRSETPRAPAPKLVRYTRKA